VRRVDGRIVIAVIFAIGVLFVGLNLVFAGASDGTRVVASPSSTPVEEGRSYTIRLLSPCVPAVDFDGSFWVSRNSLRIAGRTDPATIVLTSPDRAVLSTAAGQRFVLARRDGPLRFAACPSPS
jgi:hypothetical protein